MITTAGVRALAADLVTDELVVVPVRHHSPACARQVERAIADLTPSAVLVEGPRSFTELIPGLVHPDAEMPLAVYAYARGDDGARWAAFYPFCDYSPELVALREAAQRGIAARFVDLEAAEQRALVAAGPGPDARDGAPEPRSLLDEGRLTHSRRLTHLADRLGCRDHEDLWERLFEADPDDVPLLEHVARMVAYCSLARADATGAELLADGTLARESEMAWHVAEALRARAAGDGPVLVVVGGFHAVALPELLQDGPVRPTVDTAGVDAGAALIRYSFDRLDRLNGYASGMTSPAWHQQVWSLRTAPSAPRPADATVPARTPARARAALELLSTVADTLRERHGVPVALPSVVAAYEQARRLADLRGRPAPLRTDLIDATTSCFVKGDADTEGALVAVVVRSVLSGDAVGTLPPGTGSPPLVRDVLERLRRLRMAVDDAEPRTAVLDVYRRPAHREASRLLHGLALLAVPFAVRVAGPDFVHRVAVDRLQERWEYRWTPATEGALVEASLHGATLPEAVATRFGDRAHEVRDGAGRRSARAATDLLVLACVLGLHDQVGPALAIARDALVEDPAFDAVAAAAGQLGLLWEAREPLEARRLGRLPHVLAEAYRRAVFLGRDLQDEECEPQAVLGALVQLRELLVGDAGRDLEPELFWGMVERLADGHTSPVVRGGAVGLRYSAGRVDGDALGAAAAGHLGGTVAPADAVGFVHGLLSTAREAAWQQPGLLRALDERLDSWSAADFVAHLPQLRLAFAALTPRETDRVAGAVADLHGAGPQAVGAPELRAHTEAEVRRRLALSLQVQSLLDAEGLAAWGGSA